MGLNLCRSKCLLSKFKKIKRVKDSIKNDSIEQIKFKNPNKLKKRDKVDFLKRKKLSKKGLLKKKLLE